MLPVIAISADRSPAKPADGPNPHGRIRPTLAKVHVSELIVTHLRENRVEAILLPPDSPNTEAVVAWVLQHCQGLVISGGNFDIHPSAYGQDIKHRIDAIDAGRTNLELALAKAAIENDFPVLGICGGMQALAVAGGGTLHQDISACVEGALEHEQTTDPSTPWHPVSIETGLIRKAYGCGILRVNSTHHQAVDDPGCFDVTARAPDSVIEGIEHAALRCCVGVQWHPELIDPAPLRMLSWFASNPE